ncbi:PAS domain S-box-containing protein [Halopenitus malekzadehii]|uniref:histidine kinase n=2 Tax=Halopenitus malekzadehii TaxID=1267564 RepID=A0A1H6IAT7_9EURY|nr:PAS domain S-box-containing protein [Halopenitus malekzadehii]
MGNHYYVVGTIRRDMDPPIQVLHVDDDPAFLEMAATFLERESDAIEVVTATSVSEGHAVFDERSIDCIVSDHDMPGRNGIEFLESVRASSPEVPFILFTGKGSESVASEAVSAGVTDYLQKESGTDQYTILANRIENAVDRYRARRSARAQQRRLETLVDNVPGVVYRCRNEPGWPMESIEGECESLTGYPADRIESGDLTWGHDVVHPADREDVWETVQTSIAVDEPFEETYRIRTAAGETRWVWERGRGVSIDSEVDEVTVAHEAEIGDYAAVLEGFITDITESKRRERRFEAIVENTSQFTGLLDPDGTIIEANESALAFADVDRADVLGTPLWEGPWFTESDRARRIAREAVDTARDGNPYHAEVAISGADESAIIDFTVHPVTDADGEVTLLIPESRDITALKERERELRRFRRRFEAVFDDPAVLVGLLAPDGTVRSVNSTALGYVEVDHEDLVGEPFPETPWWPEDRREDVREWVTAAAAGEYVEFDAVHAATDDGPFTVEGTFRPVVSEGDANHTDGDVTGIVVSAKDVTERRQRERELKHHAERFDEFASVVSHDLQSPITAAQGRLELALETGDLEHVERAADAIDRVDALRTDLAETLQTGEIVSETETIPLADAVEDAVTAVDPPGSMTVDVPDSVDVKADPDAFARLLENLLRNSIEHTDGDDVTVRFDRLREEGATGFVYEDDGPGIDPADRDRVFSPGFSTKDGDSGSGMGMMSVQQIVTAHDWSIRIADADVLDGARFEIRTD